MKCCKSLVQDVKRARYEKPCTFRRREYTADDSDDEKRIERAEKATEKKAGKPWRKRGQVPGKSRSTPPRYSSAAQAQVLGTVPGVSVSQPRRQVVPAAARLIGPCHFCGEFGHCACIARSGQQQLVVSGILFSPIVL